jgi:hypothetical protein
VSTLAHLQHAFLETVTGNAAPAAPGLEVYRRTVLANLCGALAATYPVVQRLVGESFFREAAERFARAHPSRSGDLNAYGRELAQFLAGYEHAAQVPCLPDVARLEWACHESFDAADAAPLDFAALARVPASGHGRIVFALHPAVRLVASPHPLAAIWEANQPGRDGTPRRLEGEDHVLVHRDRFTVRVTSIETCEWDFLAALARGESLQGAGDAIDATRRERVLGASLARFVGDGVIAGFALPAGVA